LRRIRFHDIGLWDKEEELKFFEPKDPEHVSHSALNIQKTKNYFIAKVKPLKTIMRELGHTKLDILKIDIEGAEYKVIDSIINDQIDLNVLCVEFDEVYNSLDDQYLDRIEKYINKLLDAGFRLIDIDKYYNSTFVKHQ